MSAVEIFHVAQNPFTRYHAVVQVVNQMVGGVPKDRDTIKAWLAAKLDLDDVLLHELAEKTYLEMQRPPGEEDPPPPSPFSPPMMSTDIPGTVIAEEGTGPFEPLSPGTIVDLEPIPPVSEPKRAEVVEAIARAVEGGNGFKTYSGQLCYETRCMKAALKEAANIAYPGTIWKPETKIAKQMMGEKYRKGLRSTGAERIFVSTDLHPDFIPLGCSEPTRTEQRIKHVTTPAGPRSAITVVDVVERPRLEFYVDVLDDFLGPEEWGRVWSTIEHNGVGADRARGDGQCELVAWDRV